MSPHRTTEGAPLSSNSKYLNSAVVDKKTEPSTYSVNGDSFPNSKCESSSKHLHLVESP